MLDAADSLRTKGRKRDRWTQKQTGQFRSEGQDTAQSMFQAAQWIEDAADAIRRGTDVG